MKNYVPLIMAVILGFAAVLAVSRVLSERKQAEEDTVSVVKAARAITRGERITQDSVLKQRVPVSSRPVQAVSWADQPRIQGQEALRDIVEGDYILLSDIGMTRSMASIVGEGEWAVSLTVDGSGIAQIVQPGDEIAIIGAFSVQQTVTSADQSADVEVESKEIVATLFPRVRVLDTGQDSGMDEGAGGREIIVGLPPSEAQILIAAQRRAELTLALRRTGDDSALRRSDTGVVDEKTFFGLLEGLEQASLPDRPKASGVEPSVGADSSR